MDAAKRARDVDEEDPRDGKIPRKDTRLEDREDNGEGRQVEQAEATESRPERLFPHVEGNWATSVWIPVTVKENVVAEVVEMLEDARPDAKVEPVASPHISLSRTFPLREHQIEGFVGAVRDAVRPVAAFSLSGQHVRYFRSENRSRIFASILTSRGTPRILGLIEAVDGAVDSFQAPKYHTDPVPHISLASAIEPPELRKNDVGPDEPLAGPPVEIRARSVVVASGDKRFEVNLEAY